MLRQMSASDLLLQRSRGIHLHNSLRWFGLDSAQTWNSEHARLLHLLAGDAHESVEQLRASFRLEPLFRRNRLQQSAFAHGFGANLHRFHWRQHVVRTKAKRACKRMVPM